MEDFVDIRALAGHGTTFQPLSPASEQVMSMEEL